MSILLTASESASAGSMIPLILMYVVVFGVFFYFVLYRPQKKEQKKTSAMLSTLEIGDCVLTTSGFYGIVIDHTDDTVIRRVRQQQKLPYSDAEERDRTGGKG